MTASLTQAGRFGECVVGYAWGNCIEIANMNNCDAPSQNFTPAYAGYIYFTSNPCEVLSPLWM